ncbi:Probable pectinesterase/pectinesterase inhibitor 34 [Linum grandiflorum]
MDRVKLDYGRLGPADATISGTTTAASPHPLPPPSSRKRKLIILSLLSLALITASAVSAGLLVAARSRGPGPLDPTRHRRPSQAISRTCTKTRYPALCVNSLTEFPGSLTADEGDLVHISFNMTLQHLNRALYLSSSMSSSLPTDDELARSAYDDCLELLDDSIDALSRSLSAVAVGGGGGATTTDVSTWLSAALTNQDTCAEGLADVKSGAAKLEMEGKLKDLTELISNCLSIFSATDNGDFAGVPIQNRRLLEAAAEKDEEEEELEFPNWVGRRERKLLTLPPSAIRADIIVSADGNGTYKTIGEAIKKAPERSNRRTVIYVRAGRYEESNLKVGRKKWNLMFIGDGKGKTVITGKKSVFDKLTTFHTASFAATGAGFIARDMTFENTAGPAKHQAVALRVGADHAVIYRCNVIGYQDTLYVHSNRQFYRECDIYGTVDFVFGNAAVVLQNCSFYARKPMDMQKNTVTAQNRKDPNQNTGISIHASRILATPDLQASKGSFQTYLGRPWKLYSRTVVMVTYIGDHVHPKGWLEWNATFALDTLYYGEYMNYGPGAGVGQRVTWPGYRVIKSTVEATRFTVGQFIFGSSWLPSTGVAFLSGLSV